MPVICIILLSFLAIFVFFGLIFLLCKYIVQTGEKFVKKIQEEQADYYFCQLEAIRKKKRKGKTYLLLKFARDRAAKEKRRKALLRSIRKRRAKRRK